MADYFVYGTLCHEPLLRVVLGRVPEHQSAVLAGYIVRTVKGASFPVLVAGEGEARGLFLGGLTDEDEARLRWYEDGFRAETLPVRLAASGQVADALVFVSDAADASGDGWDLAQWERQWGATVTRAAVPYMKGLGAPAGERAKLRYPQLLTRAGSTERALNARKPSAIRRKTAPGDVVETAWREPYAGYFAVEEFDLAFRRFDGGMSETVTRAVFISGDATVVLPYDPVRDRVLLIEQWRAGPHARGDTESWLVETVAGRIDGGETPEEAARREAREEAHLELGELVPAGSYYPSPAAKGEYIYGFVGIADLPDEARGLGGLDTEDEDIRMHILSFAELMALVGSGEVDNAPLLILSYWLDRNRAAIRARYPSGA